MITPVATYLAGLIATAAILGYRDGDEPIPSPLTTAFLVVFWPLCIIAHIAYGAGQRARMWSDRA